MVANNSGVSVLALTFHSWNSSKRGSFALGRGVSLGTFSKIPENFSGLFWAFSTLHQKDSTPMLKFPGAGTKFWNFPDFPTFLPELLKKSKRNFWTFDCHIMGKLGTNRFRLPELQTGAVCPFCNHHEPRRKPVSFWYYQNSLRVQRWLSWGHKFRFSGEKLRLGRSFKIVSAAEASARWLRAERKAIKRHVVASPIKRRRHAAPGPHTPPPQRAGRDEPQSSETFESCFLHDAGLKSHHRLST